MATTSSLLNDSSSSSTTKNNALTYHNLSRSIERALDEATYTGELILNGRELREFPNYSNLNNKYDLSDTIIADLSRNRLIEFPRSLCSLFSLERLNLYHNTIKSIPEQIIQIRMLKVLDLSRNQLSNIPSSLCKLPYLEILILHNNKLISLPEEIGQLERLIELDVSSNDIIQLPCQIGALTYLRTLNIRRNMIIELPAEICNLKLIHFDCSFNRIIRLPLNLREMISLIELNVEHNPLEVPPASICTLGLLHIMRFLLVEAMKEEKRLGLLTEHEINTKYRNSFSYQGSRHLQCGTRMKKTVVPSDSGYLTTEGSEKTVGDDDSVLSMSNEHSLRSEPTLMLTLADEFSKELARQKAEYEKKKSKAQQLKIHLLQQLGETETQREKTREIARKTHEEKFAKIEKQREDARRKMENSKNIQIFNCSTKERQFSSSKTENIDQSQRSLSTSEELLILRTNRSASVELNITENENEHHRPYLCQQRSLPNESIIYSQNKNINSINENNLQYNHFTENQSTTKLKYFDARQNPPGFHMQPRISPLKNDQSSCLENPGENSEFTIRRHLLHAKEDHMKLEQMRRTIEERLKVKLPDDIGYALSDGVVLCHFINQIRPRSVQTIHVPSQAVPKLSLAKCRRNVENFLEASRRIGVPEPCLAKLTDIIAPIDQNNSNQSQQLGLFRLFLNINYLELISLNDQQICTKKFYSSNDKIIANFLLVFLVLSAFVFTYYHNYF